MNRQHHVQYARIEKPYAFGRGSSLDVQVGQGYPVKENPKRRACLVDDLKRCFFPANPYIRFKQWGGNLYFGRRARRRW
jgi:hypothetical protein